MFTHGFLQRRAAWMRRLAVSLTLAVGFTPFAALLPAAQAQGLTPASPVKSILLFPTSAAADAGTGADALTSALDDAIKLRLTSVGKYSVLSYSKFLPSVQRAITESGDGGLTDADVQPPFSQDSGQKVASLVGTDAYLINTINSYQQDPTTHAVTLVVTSKLYYSQSGNAVPNLSSIESAQASPVSASESDMDIQQSAVNDVAAKIASSLNAAAPQGAPIVAPVSQRGHSHATRNVIAGILLVALVTAIISGSHFGGGGGSSSSTSTSTSSGSGGGGGGGGTIPGPPAPPSAP